MKLQKLRISNFQSFGPDTVELDFNDLTFLIGPNGTGKTAALQALCRMFAFEPNLRRIHKSDFHVPVNETTETAPEERTLSIEAEFLFPELHAPSPTSPAIPPSFAHMRMNRDANDCRIRFRLKATQYANDEIEQELTYVLEVDENDEPIEEAKVPRSDRHHIQLHYLPARRDPSDHIAYTANSLLGRVLRAIDWKDEKAGIKELAGSASNALSQNGSVQAIDSHLDKKWEKLHKGGFFKSPKVAFGSGEIDSLLKLLSLSFSPGHGVDAVDFSRLSDGQKSMLYLSLVLSVQAIGHDAIMGKSDLFDADKLQPATFTMIAMEEPENSLSPHYLGRVVTLLSDFTKQENTQAVIATHAPSMLKRIPPESIRYLRLNPARQTTISKITLPKKNDEAYKFVREAVQSYPELYFSRLIILGEGDSEEIVLPRLLRSIGINLDEASTSIVPLGGRHVNHFWRLLHALGIPFVTLLDLDLGRHEGGWGRVRYALNQLLNYPFVSIEHNEKQINTLPKWNDSRRLLEDEKGQKALAYLRERMVFFSSPLDLDFCMLETFPSAFGVDLDLEYAPEDETIKAVLGKSAHNDEQYSDDQKRLFLEYHRLFKLGSKPATHLDALSNLSDHDLASGMPESLSLLVKAAAQQLKDQPE
ncbi:AAA family ATPase [Luteolibacter algae]|uniref:AAA family ATPase n=1 Tax=Luteolibacter algae TaxID=454151 RepID=A0ABW5DAD9_9BACT